MTLPIVDCGLRIVLRILIGGLSIGVLMSIGATEARGEVIDRVLAVAAGQLITLSDVTAARDLGLQTPGNAPDPVRGILAKLIDRELMLAEVERYGPPEPAADQVERELAAVRARFASAAAFEAALARSGYDEKHLRETIRQELRLRADLDQRCLCTDPP